MKIRFDNASRSYAGVWVFRGVSATIEPGSIVGVLGANGAGKTTILKLLAGWMPLTEGKIFFEESPMRPTATSLRRKVMLLEDKPKYEQSSQSILTRLISVLEDYKKDGEQDIDLVVANWFDRVDLTKVYGKSSKELSKGQEYRARMVELFTVSPKVWLLDEPFSAGLDAAGLRLLEDEIRAHASRGGTIFFTTQWPEHAKRLATHAMVIHDSELVHFRPTSDPTAHSLLEEARHKPALHAILEGLGMP